MRKPKPGAVMPLNIAIMQIERQEYQSGADLDRLAELRQQRAEIMARRRTEFERKQVPLFAHEIPDADPQSFLDQEDRNRRERADMERVHRRKAVVFRRRLRMLLPETYPGLRDQWNGFQSTHDPSRAASFWRTAFRENIGIDPEGLPMPSETYRLDAAVIDANKNGGFQA